MKVRYIFYTLLFLIIIFIVKTFHDAGSFKSVLSYYPGEIIQTYTNAPGPEDIEVDHQTGLMFISSSERRTGPKIRDGIYLLDLNDPSDEPRKLLTTYNGDFHPHGISLLRQDSMLYLHAVNHNDNGDFIEFFEYRNEVLHHLSSISSDMMCCPNDVIAIGKFMCYITNDHGSDSGFARTLEDYLRLPKSYILHYNGNTFTKAYKGLNYANGINVSPDGKYLYATHTTGQELLTFAIDSTDGSLELLDKLDLNTGVDNIDIDPDGNIWIGCHPKLFDFIKHAEDSTKYSPSQVLKIIPRSINPFTYSVEEVFLDDGQILSGSSVGIHYNDHLFIGVVFDSKLLRIRLD